MFGLSAKASQMILDTLKNIPEIEEASIFGSRAMGNEKKGSDIDIAIKGLKVTSETVARLNKILSGDLPLPYLFDIVDYNTISNKALKEHIDQYGKKFYTKGQSPAGDCP